MADWTRSVSLNRQVESMTLILIEVRKDQGALETGIWENEVYIFGLRNSKNPQNVILATVGKYKASQDQWPHDIG